MAEKEHKTLAPEVGYYKTAEISKRAYKTGLSGEVLYWQVDARKMTERSGWPTPPPAAVDSARSWSSVARDQCERTAAYESESGEKPDQK